MKTLLIASLLALAAASPASAHAHLTASEPADKAVVAAPAALTLHFTEGLELGLSGVDIAGPTGPVAPTGAALDPADKATLIVTLPALPAGAYTVNWHALATDGHKSTGSYSFTVK
jgi:methionine-rich copper-binding protein CopC